MEGLRGKHQTPRHRSMSRPPTYAREWHRSSRYQSWQHSPPEHGRRPYDHWLWTLQCWLTSVWYHIIHGTGVDQRKERASAWPPASLCSGSAFGLLLQFQQPINEASYQRLISCICISGGVGGAAEEAGGHVQNPKISRPKNFSRNLHMSCSQITAKFP